MEQDYLVICRKSANKTQGEFDYYKVKFTSFDLEIFITELNSKKFVSINNIIINTNEILRVCPT